MAETPNVSFAVTLFGPMQVLVNGQPPPHVRSRRTLWLLALLTLRPNRPVEREWLAGALWPDIDQDRASANLRPILSELRDILGSERKRLQTPNRLTVLLDLTGAEVDILAFDAAVNSKQISALEQAVGLYRGPLLEGCLEEWVFQEREVREQGCLQALHTLAEAAFAAGDYMTAAGFYKQAIRLDPLGDTPRRGLMEALAKSGDRNAALQVYRDFLEVLRTDPRAAPDEVTKALYLRLREEARTQAISPKAVITSNPPAAAISGYLPHPLTDLVGREDELHDVAARLRRSRLVTLTGVGGVGKTRLAIAVASDVVKEYPDGVWLVALESIADDNLVVQEVASVLSVKAELNRTLLEGVAALLRKKRLLIVLDNCEHLLEASAQLAGHLLRECMEVRILATSREALGITGETAWSVPCFAVPRMEHLPRGRAPMLRVLSGYESVQLFVERAQAIQKNFALNANNAASVAAICVRLEGLPLAIELAAARVNVMTVEQIALRLDDHLKLLTGGSRTAMARQQTLRGTLDWSYNLLDEPRRLLLRRLSVFSDGWTLEAAEYVCASGDRRVHESERDTLAPVHTETQTDILELLSALADQSLVLFDERQDLSGRYRMLEMVRQYAAEKLRSSGELQMIRANHMDWCVALAEEAEPELRRPQQEEWFRRLDAEYNNIRAAIHYYCEPKKDTVGAESPLPASPFTSPQTNDPSGYSDEAGLRLAGVLARFWDIRGDYGEGRRLLRRVLEQDAAQTRTQARAKALYVEGIMTVRQGDYVLGQELLTECLGIYRELEDWKGIAGSLGSLGTIAHGQGGFASARALFEESLHIHRNLGDTPAVAMALGNLGNVAHSQGDNTAARLLYEEGLAIQRDLGDRDGIAWSLNSLGNLALDRRDYVLARSLYNESLELFEGLGDRRGIAWSCHKMGSVASDQGDYSLAQDLYERSRQIFQELGDRHGEAWSVCALGNVAFEQNDFASAHTLYKVSLTHFKVLGDKEGIADSLGGLGAATFVQSDINQAVRLWGAAYNLCETFGIPLECKERETYDRMIERARVMLGEDAFAVVWEEGHAMTMEQAVKLALDRSDVLLADLVL